MIIGDKLKLFIYSSVILFVVICNQACKNSDNINDQKSTKDTIPESLSITAADIAGNFSSQSSLKADSTITDSFFIRHPLLNSTEKNVRSFYSRRNYSLAWFDSAGLTELAGNLYNRMQNLQAEGLSATMPYLEEADSLMEMEDIQNIRQSSITDMLLTAQYFYFANKVWGGISEANSRKIDWYLPRKKVDYEALLDSLLLPAGNYKPHAPVYRQYGLLKAALKQYTDLAAKNKWSAIVTDKKSFRVGDSSKAIAEIKKRLWLFGDMPTLSETVLFDSAMVVAVKRFQHRFGMKEDGIIDAQMLKELNVPLQKRIDQIIVNIERSRWLPDRIDGNYIAVNIPDFKLFIYDGDSLLWSMNVVVGKAANKTVIFSGQLKYVVFSPYWNVPTGILNKEVLPGIRRNKNYLAAHHMEWNGKSVRQKPGPWNSLGQVKFLFPNSHNIYLHDTPSKSLFEEDKRAFSHGCIRVQEPKKLAQFLLRNEPVWTEQRITDAMNSGKEQYVTLQHTIPVFIGYLTAWVDRQGLVNFRNDIYNRDSRLAKMIGN